MPSKKKSKAKGKKSGKAGGAAKEAEEETTTKEERGAPLDSQIQRLKIDGKQQPDDDDALLEEAIKLAAAEKKELKAAAAEKERKNCTHGYNPSPAEARFCEEYLLEYINALKAARDRGDSVGDCLIEAFKVVAKTYPRVLINESYLKLVISRCLADGTKFILDGNCNQARFYAAFTKDFERMIAVVVNETKKTSDRFDVAKLAELLDADEHTLVQFYRKQIRCKCLDERYKEVKSITKMGMCMNKDCPLPNQRAVRSKMLYCTRCRVVNYCSRECQEAAWPSHKEYCDK